MFGVAPTAKAARVLERETGVVSDTLAKLLHEWQRTDRPPLDRYRLPTGTTVIVDEAGMVGTPSLAALARLATQHDWRLALVGDHCQLQAVGRGGMFHELCATGRTHELARIHRFVEEWEATASLQLRRGDPNALDAYFKHGRVVAGTFEEQLAFVVDQWRTVHASGGVCAINASSNAHVDAVNAAVQATRLSVGELVDDRSVRISGAEHAYIGDVVVTRRNERRLTTDHGEPVRNREIWKVTGLGADGSITVSSNAGAGTVTLPADYASRHLRLGYAATEHGNQGDTTTVSIELVSDATTRRGLYVGATRGRQRNVLAVITTSDDLAEARDVLERVLANDRTDLPAIAQRRALAQEARPVQRPAVRRQEPRCTVPLWFDELVASIGASLRRCEDTIARFESERENLTEQLHDARQRQRDTARLLDPHRPALRAAHEDVETARRHVWSTNAELRRSSKLRRRAARRAVDHAHLELEAALDREASAELAAKPATDAIAETAKEVRALQSQLATMSAFERMELGYTDVKAIREAAHALHDWRRWADGHPVSTDAAAHLVHTLGAVEVIERGAADALAVPLVQWTAAQGSDVPSPAPSRSISIDLDL